MQIIMMQAFRVVFFCVTVNFLIVYFLCLISCYCSAGFVCLHSYFPGSWEERGKLLNFYFVKQLYFINRINKT